MIEQQRALMNANMKKDMQSNKIFISNRRRDLLSKTSDAEKVAALNCRRLGYKIVSQQPIETGRRLYFADIYVPELKLIIECDGGYHYQSGQKRKDKNRSSGIWRLGYHVVRLSNHDARDIKKVKEKIDLIIYKTKNAKRNKIVYTTRHK